MKLNCQLTVNQSDQSPGVNWKGNKCCYTPRKVSGDSLQLLLSTLPGNVNLRESVHPEIVSGLYTPIKRPPRLVSPCRFQSLSTCPPTTLTDASFNTVAGKHSFSLLSIGIEPRSIVDRYLPASGQTFRTTLIERIGTIELG